MLCAPVVEREALEQQAEGMTFFRTPSTEGVGLLAQMRGIDKINRLIDDGALAPGHCKAVRLHRIDGGPALLAYTASSKTRTDPGLIRDLFHVGQDAARQWLTTHFNAIGVRISVYSTANLAQTAESKLEFSSTDAKLSVISVCR